MRMRRFSSFSTLVVAGVTLAALIVFSATAARALWYTGDTEIHVPESEQDLEHEVDPGGAPERLVIPSIGVDAFVQDVGITAAGNMATPSNFSDVGWYRYGPAPGERGSAVIAGHVDNALGLAGVFKHLERIEPGDEVIVRTENGVEHRFEVTSVRSYPHDDVPTDILFNPNGARRLNLVTCDGDWLQGSRTYDRRLVVFTKLIE